MIVALDDHWIYASVYLIGFAALHSLLASLPSKRLAKKRFGSLVDPWYPILFSAIAVITLIPLAALLILHPGRLIYAVPEPWFWLFISAQLLIGVLSLRTFVDGPHRFLIRAQLAEPGGPDSLSLGIRGIYCWIRDPFLLSGLLLIWLTPFMTENMLPVYLLATIYLFMGSLHWERRLFIQFGRVYGDYKRQVPRIIPSMKRRWQDCRD